MHCVPKLLPLLCVFIALGFIANGQATTYRELDSIQAMSRRFAFGISTKAPLQTSSYNRKENRLLAVAGMGLSRQAQTTCADTSERFFLQTDSVTYYSYNPRLTHDGYVLLSGEYARWNGSWKYKGYLLKTDLKGSVVWLHTYDSLNHVLPYHYINYSTVIELKDGSIFLAGRTNNAPGKNEDIIFTKTDALGNIIWTKLYKCRLWTPGNGSADYWYAHEIKEDPQTGDIYISAGHWATGKSLSKLNSMDGTVIWSRSFDPAQYAIFDSPLGLDIRPNEIRYFGKFLSYNNAVVCAYRLSKQTGDTLQTRYFKSADTTGTKVDFLGNDPMTVLQNGNYAFSGKCYGQYQYLYTGLTPLYQAAVMELDSNLNFVRAYAFTNHTENNSYNTRVSVFTDGTALFTMLRFSGGYSGDLHYVQTRNGQIIKQRKKAISNEGHPYEPVALRLPDGSDALIRLYGDSALNKSKIEFLKLHPSDTSSACLGYDNTETAIYPFKYIRIPYALDSVRSNLFSENGKKTQTVENLSMEKTAGCFTVSFCDSLKLLSPASTVCLAQPLLLTVRKNKNCGSLVPLSFDTSAVQSVTAVNDSTVSLRFKKAWSGYIHGSLQGCTLLKDSLFVQVLQTPDSLNIGPDRSLCPGNTILLNAHKGYASYLWQDGSTDSAFTVLQPGLYFVTTTDACGGVFKDSITITAAPPISFDAGPDRTKCNNDTLHLNAPPGFLNYTWSNNYNISSTTAQNVVINPSMDTAYYIKAEKTPGCFAYDTVRITVHHSPPIDLGNDKSFCLGDSAVFDAGAGFQTYAWSGGQSNQRIAVKTAGTYSVVGTTTQGCKSPDTVKVLNVYSLPFVSLDKKASLCFGDSKTLNAGSFASYSWSTGQNTAAIVVNALGQYAVIVTDANGCKGSDTTAITTINPLPAGFLPLDTAVCSYGSVQLKPLALFSRYLWSTSEVNPSITVLKPGLYWLEVVDGNTCKGRDTITVNPKDCMKGFFAPAAFTPNGDGKNDAFYPLLFGKVKAYHFTVYNRWGQAIFQTDELQKGWDGKVAGIVQRSDVFVWTCSYQFEGEAAKTEKGTVTLIR